MNWLLPRARTFVDEARAIDLDLLAAIHETSFARGWSAEELASLVSQDNVACLVLRRTDFFGRPQPLGFVLVRSAADEAEILTVAVEPSARGRGYGRRLVEEAMRRLYRERIGALFLEVDEGNRAALSIYRRLGFETIGTRAGYYTTAEGGRATALVMRMQFR